MEGVTLGYLVGKAYVIQGLFYVATLTKLKDLRQLGTIVKGQQIGLK